MFRNSPEANFERIPKTCKTRGHGPGRHCLTSVWFPVQEGNYRGHLVSLNDNTSDTMSIILCIDSMNK